MAEDSDGSDVLGPRTQTVSPHVSNNLLAPTHFPSLIREVYRTLASVGRRAPAPDKPQPTVPVKRSCFRTISSASGTRRN
jgi:predicted transcriptional regulator